MLILKPGPRRLSDLGKLPLTPQPMLQTLQAPAVSPDAAGGCFTQYSRLRRIAILASLRVANILGAVCSVVDLQVHLHVKKHLHTISMHSAECRLRKRLGHCKSTTYVVRRNGSLQENAHRTFETLARTSGQFHQGIIINKPPNNSPPFIHQIK